MKTKVVHCKRKLFDVLIDRTTPFGNPFPITEKQDREKVIAKHRKWLNAWLNKGKEIEIGYWNNRWVCEHLYMLKGKTIGCWCAPKHCHGHTLAELADSL